MEQPLVTPGSEVWEVCRRTFNPKCISSEVIGNFKTLSHEARPALDQISNLNPENVRLETNTKS